MTIARAVRRPCRHRFGRHGQGRRGQGRPGQGRRGQGRRGDKRLFRRTCRSLLAALEASSPEASAVSDGSRLICHALQQGPQDSESASPRCGEGLEAGVDDQLTVGSEHRSAGTTSTSPGSAPCLWGEVTAYQERSRGRGCRAGCRSAAGARKTGPHSAGRPEPSSEHLATRPTNLRTVEQLSGRPGLDSVHPERLTPLAESGDMEFTPHWLDTAPPGSRPVRTEIGVNVDVAIFGAGPTGHPAALHLARKSADVHVFVTEAIGLRRLWAQRRHGHPGACRSASGRRSPATASTPRRHACGRTTTRSSLPGGGDPVRGGCSGVGRAWRGPEDI